MSTDANTNHPTTGTAPAPTGRKSQKPSLLKLPGLIAISLYMLLLSGVTVVSVMNHRAGALYLIFSVLFIAGALGLLLLLRWAWALTLAAVALLSGSFLWGFSLQHSYPSLVQGLLNLVFFLYLVRSDVREKLK
ncbi:MAG: hypothetical protein ACLPLZ_17025 [Terracidiphilus sp.]